MKAHYFLLAIGVWLFEASLTVLPYLSILYSISGEIVGALILTLTFLVCGTLTMIYFRNRILKVKVAHSSYSHMDLLEHEVDYSRSTQFEQESSRSVEHTPEKT